MSKVLGIDALAGIRDWVKSEDDAVKAELRTYVGSPLVASTVAGMTDQTKVYVYTGSETGYTAGNWYYYNGSAWTSGGVYNSTALETDPTLTIEGMAADAKATGDEITHVKQDNSKLQSQVSQEITDTDIRFRNLTNNAFYNRYITAWAQGYRHNQGGSLTPDGDYITSYSPVNFTKGDVLLWDSSHAYYYLVYPDGTYYRTGFAQDFTFPESVTVYLEVKDSGGTSASVPHTVTFKSKSGLVDLLATVDSLEVNDTVYHSTKSNSIVNNADFTKNGLLNSDGSFTADSVAGHLCTDFIYTPQDVMYVCTATINGSSGFPRYVFIYNADKTKSRQVASNANNNKFYLTGSETYIRININTTNPYDVNVVPFGVDNDVPAINSDVFIPEKAYKTLPSIIHKRRPIVSFTLDGDYDMNDEFFDLFDSLGYKLSVCLGYRNTDLNYTNSPSWYLEKQKNGHEIMSYSTFPLPESSDKTLTEAEEIIHNSYAVLKSYGFDVRGLIGSTGGIASRYMPSVYKYFDFAASKDNHSGSQESCLFFATDNPYNGWRYSMQLSTLVQMKAAVDRAISECGLLQFYTHAESANIMNSTIANVTELLYYIKSKGADIRIMTPTQAYHDYYAIRYDDVMP